MDELISEMSNLIYHIAHEFTSNSDLINDLYNQGILGLYDAYNHYDKNSGTKFSSYAYMYIYGKMYSYINQDRCFKINKDVLNTYKLIMKAKDYLMQELKTEVSVSDISKYLEIDESVVVTTINIMKNPLSLDYEYDDATLSSFIKNDDNIDSLEFSEILDGLSLEEKKVIMYKYYSGYNQSEIAKMMNMSQAGVSRCEQKAKERIRTKIN